MENTLKKTSRYSAPRRTRSDDRNLNMKQKRDFSLHFAPFEMTIENLKHQNGSQNRPRSLKRLKVSWNFRQKNSTV